MAEPTLAQDSVKPADPAPSPHGGVNISGDSHVNVQGDIVAGDKYVGYTAEQVDVLLTQIRTEFQPKAFDGRSPYVGLDAFQETDADRFFGRETLIAELVSRVRASRAIFVTGPSGSGKSSLVRAGLIPALKKNGVPGSEHWMYETLKPGRSPLDELGRVTASFASTLNARDDIKTRGLADATILDQWADIALKDDSNRRAVILIDQFEEVFAQVADENERSAFLKLLTYAATRENGRVIVVFTMRSEFVANCASYPALNALLNQQFLQVGAMTNEELVSAIARPALEVGLRMDPALVAQVVNDVRGEPGALPLMQFALQDLFDAEKDKGELTLDEYLKRGGLRQALERHADAEFEKLSADDQQLARSVISGLIQIGHDSVVTKRTALFDELVPAGADIAHVKNLVNELADARLLSTDEHNGKETVVLAHESLLEAWGWLRRLVNENRDAIALKNEIGQDAQQWDEAGRSADYLYRGARLATAQEKLQDKQLALGGLAQEFIQAGITARDAERAKQEQQRQEELARAQQLADEQKKRADEQQLANQRLRRRNVILAVILALTLLFGLAACLFLYIYLTSNGLAVDSVAFSPDGAVLAAGVTDGTIHVWKLAASSDANAPQYQPAEKLAKGSSLGEPAIAFSPDGRFLAAGYADWTVQLWNMTTFQPEGKPFNANAKPIRAVAFSPDGKLLATGNSDGTASLWDMTTRQLISKLPVSGLGNVDAVAFSPNGKLLATTGGLPPSISFWDVAAQRRLDTGLDGHTDTISSLAFSPDGKLLASASSDKTVRLWDVAAHQQLGEPLDRRTRDLTSVAFSPDGKLLAAAGFDFAVTVWDVASRKQVLPPLSGSTRPVLSVAFRPDGKLLASAGKDGMVRLWDVATGKQVAVLNTQ